MTWRKSWRLTRSDNARLHAAPQRNPAMSLQFDAKRRCTLVAGCSGSGKTTFALRYIVADKKLACRFIFDPEGEYAARLRLPSVETPEEIPLAVADGFVIFDPSTMFPGENEKAFDWFCSAVFETASALPGRKVFLIDEAWKYCPPNKVAVPLRTCIQTGRKRGLEMFFVSQQPNRLNEVITNEITELVLFRLQGVNALSRAESLGAHPSAVASLTPGQYIARNCDTGRELRGKVF